MQQLLSENSHTGISVFLRPALLGTGISVREEGSLKPSKRSMASKCSPLPVGSSIPRIGNDDIDFEPEDYRENAIPPAKEAVTEAQKASIAELPKSKKYALYEQVTEDNLTYYHQISCRPITKKAEDDLELVSDIVTWGERYLHHWDEGIYSCSRCLTPLYSSSDKYHGPCVWPSFRQPVSQLNVSTQKVSPYNKYTVTVKEVYCGNCDLFIGHQFEDARAKGDTHPNAHWRH